MSFDLTMKATVIQFLHFFACNKTKKSFSKLIYIFFVAFYDPPKDLLSIKNLAIEDKKIGKSELLFLNIANPKGGGEMGQIDPLQHLISR